MGPESYLHADAVEYDRLHARAKGFFYIDRRFPDDVFRKAASRTVFVDFDEALSEYLWPALSELAEIHGDEAVDLVAIEPELGTLRFPAEWNVFPSFSLDVTASADEFRAATSELSPDGISQMIGDLSDVFAITGASGLWGCWGERPANVMAISAPESQEFQQWRRKFQEEWRDAYEALSLVARGARNMRLPISFVEPFVDNYMWTVGLRPLDLVAR
ncbi:hypothetical protein [Nocardia sp. NPDC060259]|uniref:hypothetical protein n=1 Tax=Nocardia sp. NPDC060259 TaxID=3347088 RepID=UPI00365A9797